ncbi:hypothetical protein [Niallia sp. FSL W8-0635]|uniref:hypothetical protein n=1 Tax=Niallia sp. FSL W8-0635 TaxID=2975337 RepID=UPI002B05078E|nr:hypothetical protein [Yersinia enterocolitica]
MTQELTYEIGIRLFPYFSTFLRNFINFDKAIDIIIMMDNKYCTIKKTVKFTVICSTILSTNFIDICCRFPHLESREFALIGWEIRLST